MNRDENTLLGKFASLHPTTAGESRCLIYCLMDWQLWTDNYGLTL